jgi:diketogulonate reductase-like aldo/keto reductase
MFRIKLWAHYNNETLIVVGDKYNKSNAQVALRYLFKEV